MRNTKLLLGSFSKESLLKERQNKLRCLNIDSYVKHTKNKFLLIFDEENSPMNKEEAKILLYEYGYLYNEIEI